MNFHQQRSQILATAKVLCRFLILALFCVALLAITEGKDTSPLMNTIRRSTSQMMYPINLSGGTLEEVVGQGQEQALLGQDLPKTQIPKMQKKARTGIGIQTRS
ncbi:hypothetical protein ACH5RR_020412 [Cinchona calisaya]|uniref:Uncharacterized protein n=1 Tax=Cinchona calisaya TaxID=153742 RepID=A0ABD2ZFI5_9GENT